MWTISDRRTPRRTFAILATIGLVAGMLAVLAPGANASKGGCSAKNTTTGRKYGNLQKAIDAAASGTTLEVRGLCAPGSGTTNDDFFIEGAKTLTLLGVATTRHPKATLAGNGSTCSVLVVRSTVTLTDLDITGGTAGNCAGGNGGGIQNSGTLTLNGTTSVYGNSAENAGGGIYTGGTLTLSGSATVHDNSAGTDGGGIYNGGTLTLSGSSSVSGNTAGTVGGGIVNDRSSSTLTLNGSSSVSGNTASVNGGGIFNLGSITLNDSSAVSGNTASNSGGGILSGASGTVTLNGFSSVSGNTASSDGGGIYDNQSTVTLNGSSSVSGNSAGSRGGGIFVAAGTFPTLNGSSSVSGNTAPTCPDIYPCT